MGLILLIVLVWFVLSVKIVGPDEMAIKVLFGNPAGFCGSGFCFVPFLPGLKCYLARYPKKIYKLDYNVQEALSAEGEFDGAKCGRQNLRVDAAAYINFPKDKDSLIRILKARIPVRAEELRNWTSAAIVHAVRVAVSRMTWKEAIGNFTRLDEEAQKAIENDRRGIMPAAGFDLLGIRLVVTQIDLPAALRDALPAIDVASVKAQAAEAEAKQRAVKNIGAVIESMALAYGKTASEIQELIRKDPKLEREFSDYSKDIINRVVAIDGESFLDIRVGGAEGLEKSALALLGALKKLPETK